MGRVLVIGRGRSGEAAAALAAAGGGEVEFADGVDFAVASPGVRVMSSADDNIEVISPLADKGRALGMLCQELGTSLDRCIAMGDSENDLEMLAAVGMPVAMGNATDEVKRLAHYITASNAEDGVAQAIYHLLGDGL